MRKVGLSAFIFLLFIFSGSNIPLQSQPSGNYSAAVKKRIKQVVNNLARAGKADSIPHWTLIERMKLYKVKGVSIAVIKDFKIDWAQGFGWADSSEHRRVTLSTLFQAGSISKSLHAVGVLKLVQDGKLDLYADINKYLKTWQFPYDSFARDKKISTANLLSHTAGLTIHGFPGYTKKDSLPRLIDVLDGKSPANTKAVRSQFAPSLKYKYSGGGTTISQLIMEDITGEAYNKFMLKYVLQPIGMAGSSYAQPPGKNKKLLATGYDNIGKEVTGKYHLYPEQAAAGLWTTPTDLAKYIIETQLSLVGKSNKVLSQEITRIRLTAYVDSAVALGVFIERNGSRKFFLHSGRDEGFVAQYIGSFEGGDGAVVMANTHNPAILAEIINSIASVYHWNDVVLKSKEKGDDK